MASARWMETWSWGLIAVASAALVWLVVTWVREGARPFEASAGGFGIDSSLEMTVVSDPDRPNCPRCNQPLTYRQTGIGSHRKGDIITENQAVQLYFCEQHGFYSRWPDGRLRYAPSSYRPTELDDQEEGLPPPK